MVRKAMDGFNVFEHGVHVRTSRQTLDDANAFRATDQYYARLLLPMWDILVRDVPLQIVLVKIVPI